MVKVIDQRLLRKEVRLFDTKRFGDYLAVKRRNAGMTQADVAERLSLTRQSVSAYETGECFPDISVVIELAKLFEITIDELVMSGVPDT